MTDAASTVPGWKPFLIIVDDDPLFTDTLACSLDSSGKTVNRTELEAELDLRNDRHEEAEVPREASAPMPQGDDLLQDAVSRIKQTPFNLYRLLADTEQRYIEAILLLTRGNVSSAARLPGIRRTTLYHRMETQAKE